MELESKEIPNQQNIGHVSTKRIRHSTTIKRYVYNSNYRNILTDFSLSYLNVKYNINTLGSSFIVILLRPISLLKP